MFGFRSFSALTDFDILPGAGLLAFLHSVTMTAGLVAVQLTRGTSRPEDNSHNSSVDYSSCVQPASPEGQTSVLINTSYMFLCVLSLCNLIQIVVQQRRVLYNPQTVYMAKKLRENPGASAERLTSFTTSLGPVKDIRSLWDCFLTQFPVHSFMVSYNWWVQCFTYTNIIVYLKLICLFGMCLHLVGWIWSCHALLLHTGLKMAAG